MSIIPSPQGRQKLYLEITLERGKQDAKWGGPAHDDSHDIYDWTEIIANLLERAEEPTEGPAGVRKHLVRIAAVAVAAIESFDRKAERQLKSAGADAAHSSPA